MNIDASKEKLKKLKKESTNYHNEIQKLEEGVKKSENDIVNQEKQIE
jgi:predicted  nucleic acid-binding Zn-ribbon protein